MVDSYNGDDNELNQMVLAIVFEPSFPFERRMHTKVLDCIDLDDNYVRRHPTT